MIVNELKYTVTVPDKRMREGNFEIYKEFVAFCRAVGCPGITIASGIV
jgi:predicted metal-binding protein